MVLAFFQNDYITNTPAQRPRLHLSLSRPESNRDHRYTSQAPRPNSSKPPDQGHPFPSQPPEKTALPPAPLTLPHDPVPLGQAGGTSSSDVSAMVPSGD